MVGRGGVESGKKAGMKVSQKERVDTKLKEARTLWKSGDGCLVSRFGIHGARLGIRGAPVSRQEFLTTCSIVIAAIITAWRFSTASQSAD